MVYSPPPVALFSRLETSPPPLVPPPPAAFFLANLAFLLLILLIFLRASSLPPDFLPFLVFGVVVGFSVLVVVVIFGGGIACNQVISIQQYFGHFSVIPLLR